MKIIQKKGWKVENNIASLKNTKLIWTNNYPKGWDVPEHPF